MYFHPKSLFIALILLCCASDTWAQTTARHAALPVGLKKPVPAHLRIASHEDRPTLCYQLDWNDSLADWDSVGKVFMSYYPDGDQSEAIRQHYNNGIWENYGKFVNQYDNNHNLSQWFVFQWNGTAWDSVTRHVQSWNAQGHETLDIKYEYNGSSWDSTFSERYTYTYHSGNLVSERIYESYNPFSHAWEPVDRWVYHYTPQNEWDSLTFYYPFGVNQWIGGERFVDVIFHDFSKELAASYRYQSFSGTWDDIERAQFFYGVNDSYVAWYENYTGTWDSSGKDIYDLDAMEHTLLSEYYAYTNGFNFSDGYRYQYTYDGLGHTLESIQENTVNAVYRNNVKWVCEGFFAVGRPEPSTDAMAIQAWPNPVTDVLHILPRLERPSPTQLSLLDLQGRVQWQQTTRLSNAELEIDLPEELANGTYFLQIETAEGRWMQKIVLMR